MNGLFDRSSESRAERRAQAKLERQELAHRQAQAFRYHVPRYENEIDIHERPNALRRGDRLLMLLLFLALTVSLLLTVVLGAVAYRSVAVHHGEQNVLREQMSAIANSIHALDVSGSVSVRSNDGGSMLVLSEDVKGQKLETRYYLYEGQVLQEHVPASASVNPDTANKVCSSSVFGVQVSESMVTVATDAGVSRVFLRSTQKGGK